MDWTGTGIQERSDDEIIREHDIMMAMRGNVGVSYLVAERSEK